MDKMEFYEVKAVMDYGYYTFKDSWEQARLISYMIAQTNSTKKLKLSDILEYYWDNETDKADTSLSNEDVERLKQKAKQYELLFNGE